MKKYSVVQVGDLNPGDHFYFLSDKQKRVWTVKEIHETGKVTVKSFDRQKTVEIQTKTVYLRSED